jgi:hypothetical protein
MLRLVPPPGCSLSLAELGEQRARARRLVPTALEVARTPDTLHVTFGDDVDPALVEELIATERSCCSFLTIDYDRRERRLSIGSVDAQGREVVSRFHVFFEGAVR